MLTLLCSSLHLGCVLRGVLVEVLETGLAAEIHVGAFVRDFDRLAHLA